MTDEREAEAMRIIREQAGELLRMYAENQALRDAGLVIGAQMSLLADDLDRWTKIDGFPKSCLGDVTTRFRAITNAIRTAQAIIDALPAERPADA